MYSLIRKILFNIDPERIHTGVMKWLNIAYKIPLLRKWLKSTYVVKAPSLERTLWGITFPNPVGLAAGFDKAAVRLGRTSVPLTQGPCGHWSCSSLTGDINFLSNFLVLTNSGQFVFPEDNFLFHGKVEASL